MFFRLSIVLSLLLLLTAQMHAAEITLRHGSDFDFVTVIGEIRTGDKKRIVNLVESKAKTSDVLFVFNSEGGNFEEALKIGTYIRSKHFDTVIRNHDICYSSCFFSFIGGEQRIIMPDGILGVHELYVEEKNGSDSQSADDAAKALALNYTEKMGVNTETVKLAFQTPQQSIYVFSKKEIEDYLIADIGPSSDPRDNNSAAETKQNNIFWQKNGWYILSQNTSCKMIKKGLNGKIIEIAPVAPRFILMVFDTSPLINSSLPDDTYIDFALKFDGQTLSTPATIHAKTKNGWSLINLITEEEFKNFITDKSVKVVVDGKILEEINLDGALEASRQLGLCALSGYF